jgi:hypothetical protein
MHDPLNVKGTKRIKLIQSVFTFILRVFKYTTVHAYVLGDKSLTKQQFVVTHPDTASQETENLTDPSTYQQLSMLCFYGNIRKAICVDTTF